MSEIIQDTEDDELEQLLLAAVNDDEKKNNENISTKLNNSLNKSTSVNNNSLVHAEESNSSDDEDVRNFLEQKYNEYGKGIQSSLKKQQSDLHDRRINQEIDKLTNNVPTKKILNSLPTTSFASTSSSSAATPIDSSQRVYCDPIFNIRLVNPLISSKEFKERMIGRRPVHIHGIPNHVKSGNLKDDWVVSAVITQKCPIKTSQKGSIYSVWKLSDLKGDCKTISLFLFGDAHKNLWKTAEGCVIAILNPDIYDNNNDRSDLACLKVTQSDRIMILGQSKDLGTCKSLKKNGEQCMAIVNLYTCPHCIFHVKQEYGKLSKRSELQSSTAGRGLNGTSLRNKILGKSEVFYGGQSFVAIPAKKNPKLVAKDQKRLASLSEYYHQQNQIASGDDRRSGNVSTTGKYLASQQYTQPTSKIASGLETQYSQRLKDMERLKQLSEENKEKSSTSSAASITCATTTSTTSTNSQTLSKAIIIPSAAATITAEQFKNRQFSLANKVPKLSGNNLTIDLNAIKRSELSKSKAAEILKQKPLLKSNPNFIKYRGTDTGRKRILDEFKSNDNDADQNDEQASVSEPKRKKLSAEVERFRDEHRRRIIEAKSSHTNLIEKHEQQEQEKYFDKLEKKEAMEAKMLSTFKIECKAVICLKCKYTAFSAADNCKEQQHPFKVIDTFKRFFECSDCGNRTVTVHRIPTMSCKNCQSSKWKRTAMIRERNVNTIGDQLSIRGLEEKFIGNTIQNAGATLNLCVPE